MLCFPSGYFFTSSSSAPFSFISLIGVYGLATGNHLPCGHDMVSTAAALGLIIGNANVNEFDLQVSVRPLTSVELGSENRNRLVSWLTCSELSSGSDTNAGPRPNTGLGAFASASTPRLILETNSPAPMLPAASPATIVLGRTGNAMVEIEAEVAKATLCLFTNLPINQEIPNQCTMSKIDEFALFSTSSLFIKSAVPSDFDARRRRGSRTTSGADSRGSDVCGAVSPHRCDWMRSMMTRHTNTSGGIVQNQRNRTGCFLDPT